jgi:16S rRNA (uracil1498-N3)-methyltransferase
VSPPLFLVDELPDGPEARLDGPEGHHAATVQRLRAGERIVLGDGRGTLAVGVVARVEKGSLSVHLETRSHEPPADPRIAVVQGIAKGDRGELAVQAMTEVGVDAIVPWRAERSIARWRDDRPLERWRATAREAAKQARRAWLPEVSAARSTAELLAELPGFACVLDEAADRRLSSVELPAGGEIALVVGPEGGIAPGELAAFTAAGALPVRLGPAILRTSTAGVAAVAAVSVLVGRW